MATAKLPGGRRVDLYWRSKPRRSRRTYMLAAMYRGKKGGAGK